MALTVVEKKCSAPTGRQMRVVVGAPTRAEVDSKAAEELARQYAQKNGFVVRGLDNVAQVYPVGPDGNDDSTLLEKMALGQAPLVGYEAEFKFNAPL